MRTSGTGLAISVAILSTPLTAAEATPTPAGTFSDDGAVQSLPIGTLSQTRSPDNGALSIIIDNAKVDDQSVGPLRSVALVTGVVAIVPVRSTYIVIDLRGSAFAGDGRCRTVLTTPFGATTFLPSKDGQVFGRWKVSVPKSSREFSFTALVQCYRGSGAVSASIDSLDLTWGAMTKK